MKQLTIEWEFYTVYQRRAATKLFISSECRGTLIVISLYPRLKLHRNEMCYIYFYIYITYYISVYMRHTYIFTLYYM